MWVRAQEKTKEREGGKVGWMDGRTDKGRDGRRGMNCRRERDFYNKISRSSQCSTTGVTKAVVCVILSVG